MSTVFKRKCPLCDCGAGTLLGKLNCILTDDNPLPDAWSLVSCEKCNFIFCDAECSQKILDDFYAEHYFPTTYLNQRRKYDPVVDRDDNPLEILMPLLNTKNNAHEIKICDIGCGRGNLLKEFRDIGFTNLYGIEPSKTCIAHLEAHTDMHAALGDIYTNPFNEKFSLILCTHVFEHVWDIKKALENITSNLLDEGLLYIEVPDAERYVDYNFDEVINIHEHVNHFTRYHLSTVLKNFGFEILKMHSAVADDPEGICVPCLCIVAQKTTACLEEKILNTFDPGILAKGLQNICFPIDAICDRFIRDKVPVYIWGVNLAIQGLLAKSSLRNCMIAGIVDIDKRKQVKTLNGISISHPELLKRPLNKSVVIVGSYGNARAIKAQLKEMEYSGSIYGLKGEKL